MLVFESIVMFCLSGWFYSDTFVKEIISVNCVKTLFCSLLDMADQKVQAPACSTDNLPNMEKVSCVMCVYEQNKALKSHLLYFPSHFETPHEKAAGLKSTGIITTWRGKKTKKKKRVGKNHLRSLELLSRINQTILCQFCTEAAIQPVDNVPEEAEHREGKSEMRREKDQARGTAEN